MHPSSPSTSERSGSERLAVVAVLVLFVCLGVCYSLVVPPFETPDEIFHFAFARHLSQGNPLPVQTVEAKGPWKHEGTQAPLYYFLAGRLTAWIDQTDFDQINRQNPHANLGDPLYPGNKNLMLYSARSLPFRGTNLAMHIGRWFSLALGCLTILMVYLTARLAFPDSPYLRWLTALIVASLPQFAFISAAVSNDSMIILVSTTAIFWLARLVAREKTQAIQWWEWGVLGILLGLAAISKLQGLALFAPASIVVLWLAWQRRTWRLPFVAAALILTPALAIAGWWYWRNFTLYGDWLGIERLLTINGMRTQALSWGASRGELRGLRYSFWGLFGWFSIILPGWIYVVFDAISVVALAGFATAGIRTWIVQKRRVLDRPSARVKALLALWAAILGASMLYWATFATSSQGRLLFPALSSFGVILIGGLATWTSALPPRWRPPVLTLLPASMVACSVYALTILLPSSYRAPAPMRTLPPGVHETHILYGEQVELVAASLPEGRFKPGEAFPVTLYWRTPETLTSDYELFVQLLDEDRKAIANVTSHPGWGRNPTSLWQPGAIYPDSYELALPGGLSSRAPLVATLYVGLIDPASGAPFQAYDANGVPVEGMVGQIPLVSSRKAGLSTRDLTPVRVTFLDSIRLAGYAYPAVVEGPRQATGSNGSPVVVRLLWEAGGQPQGEYTAFVHLVRPGGDFVTGFDRAPTDRGFTTAYWEEGDRFLSDFMVSLPPDLPPGNYQLWAGLYRSDSQGNDRLPVQDADRPVQDDRVLLGSMEIQ
jgi:Dolichyl-phosphate-mannose-protein mannosyltransferase